MKPETINALIESRNAIAAECDKLADAVRVIDDIIDREQGAEPASAVEEERPPPRAKGEKKITTGKAPLVTTMDGIRRAKAPEQGTLAARILDLLADGKEWSIGVVADTLQTPYPSTSTQLAKMAKEGTLERPRPGMYRKAKA